MSDGAILEFESQYACRRRGLSGGSVMMIVLLVLVVVYLAAGYSLLVIPSYLIRVSYNKFRGEKEGIELIPNIDFWRAVPELVVEGFQFTISTIKGGN